MQEITVNLLKWTIKYLCDSCFLCKFAMFIANR